MAFQLSPGVNFSEIDLTNATAAVATTEGAIAGVFRWGPINERTLITSETQLVDVFGAPNTRFTDNTNTSTWTNHETFYTASNFLGYSDALYVTRVVETLEGGSDNAAIAQDTSDDIHAKYYGELGNSVLVSYCTGDTDGAAAFNGIAGVSGSTVTVSNSNAIASGETVPNNKKLTFFGLGTSAEAAKLKKGDKITIRKGANHASSVVVQELILAADATIVGSAGVADTEEVDTGNAPNSATAPTEDGIIIHNGTGGSPSAIAANILASSIICLDQVQAVDDDDAAAAIQVGDPVQFDAGTGGVPAGLEDGKIYFAIPVGDGANGTIGETVTTGNTRCYKLAASYQDAKDHTDAAPKNIQITALALATSVGTFSFFENFTATVETTTAYTGIDTGTMYYDRGWGDADQFDSAPTSTSNLHIVVKDKDGEITGTAGTILETYENVSETPGAKKADGSSNFVTDILLNNSNWISLAEDHGDDLNGFQSHRELTGGSDGRDEKAISLGNLALGYDTFQDATKVDVSFILQGKARGQNGYELANYIIDNIAESRRDCVAFVSPHYFGTGGDAGSNEIDTSQEVVDWAASVSASTYAVVDSGYKYQYDKYADAYRWVPLNGDIAGLCARTDDLRDPWFSPAGYNRGSVKNVVKLKINPNKSQRDLLYKNGINPVITQPGQGTVLFGDKTYAGKTSAFDRINVRRLFIVLEKTIANAAKSTLFEFNDEFTRATFRNLVEPFLRDVQGRRGIYDFKVICDETNNTGQVIDTNSFVGDIYIKPARSINFIQLNFVAVRTGVEFSEVVGAA